jgi:hypothetical protein
MSPSALPVAFVAALPCIVCLAFGAGCSPEAGTPPRPPGAGGDAGGSGGAPESGGSAGLVGTGGAGAAGAQPPTGGSGGQPGTGGTGALTGTGGTAPQTDGFSSQLGVAPDTPLGSLEPSQLLITCEAYNLYYSEVIPQADQVRAACVYDAVVVQGVVSVADCTEKAEGCIQTHPGFPPPPCVAPDGPLEGCPATVAEFEACATDLVESHRVLAELHVCESLEVPDIESQIAAAAAKPESCDHFAANCPSFFLAPPPLGADAG